MANEKNEETNLAQDSFEELRYIFKWSLTNRDYRAGDLCLVGGWAVHSFNPWKYSLDIDFLATGRFKDLLKKELYVHRGFKKERDTTGNNIFLKPLDSGDIYLDFVPKRDKFHGTEKTLNLMEFKYEITSHNISYSFGPLFEVIVPEISMLLILKLKAAWDRYYDLSSENIYDKSYLNEKFTKDCGDIIALLQSDSFKVARFELLSLVISRYDFLIEFLKQGIIEKNSALERTTLKDSKALIKKLLSLIL